LVKQPPEQCVEAYYLQRTRFESIVERKLRRRQLTEDGNLEISGRDLREVPAAAQRLPAGVACFRPKPVLHITRGSWHSDCWRATRKGGILRFGPSRSEVPAVKSPRSTSIPKTMQRIYDAVVALTDTFCRGNLNDEYRDLARAMTAALCRKRPSPLASGQPRTWACGIMYALGQLNFLSDKATQPYMAMTDVCAAFGVGQSTGSGKARVVSDALHTYRMDPAWMLPSIVDQNPLVWMAEVNGFLVDLREMPREVQEIAFAKGLIPYIPADRG
jgi:hypothetical protein